MDSAEKEKIQFAANMTHDLRNPIAGIKIAAEVIMKKHIYDADEERLLQNIVKTSNKLDDIITHILKMSKESSAEEAICTFSLNQLITDVIDTVSLAAEAKNLILRADLLNDKIITADRFRCFRILLNLVENAVKYTEKGHIIIRGQHINGIITFQVEDTGIGISKKEQAEIFKCYTQLRKGYLNSKGIGLGLHLALVFARQMGGEITVKSKKYKGSTFSFSFKPLN
ncbi:MAG: sensor histidine kinase [Gammaproteobacteria bacterium]